MKIKPILYSNIKTTHTSFEVDFDIENNITFIIGDSGVGKSAVYSFLQEMSVEDKKIRCFNYLDKGKGYKTSIKNSKNRLFIIDNADILLDDKFRQYIAFDTNNQYIIIGRNPSGLMLRSNEIYEIENKCYDGKICFYLVKALA